MCHRKSEALTFKLSTTILLVTCIAKVSEAVPFAASSSLLEGKSAKATRCAAGGGTRLLALALLLIPKLLNLRLRLPACNTRLTPGSEVAAVGDANQSESTEELHTAMLLRSNMLNSRDPSAYAPFYCEPSAYAPLYCERDGVACFCSHLNASTTCR